MIIKGEIAPAGGMVHQGILNLIRQNVSFFLDVFNRKFLTYDSASS